MPTVTLRPSHKAVQAYYESLAAFKTLGEEHEQAVRSAFATLLETAAKPFGWKLVPEHSMRVKGGKRIAPDGTLMDLYRLHHGHWEAKDTRDDLGKEIKLYRCRQACRQRMTALLSVREKTVAEGSNLIVSPCLPRAERLVQVPHLC